MNDSNLPETITLSRIEYQTLMRALALALKRAESSLAEPPTRKCRSCNFNAATVCDSCEHRNQDRVEEYTRQKIYSKVHDIAESMRESLPKNLVLSWANALEKCCI